MAIDYWTFITTTYNAPVLTIPPIAGLVVPANPPPDNALPISSGITIRMHLTSLTGPPTAPVPTTTTLPIITPAGQSYGGQIGLTGPYIIPKLTLEGYIDTPSAPFGEYNLSQVYSVPEQVHYYYGQVLAMMMEGRANAGGFGWDRLDPAWFRDPYGRVYTQVRILDFSSSWVEGVPQREQFSMTLRI